MKMIMPRNSITGLFLTIITVIVITITTTLAFPSASPAPAPVASPAAAPTDKDVQNQLLELGFIDLRQYGRSIFGEPDKKTGEIIARYNPAKDIANPEELGSYLEGDILMPLGQARNGLSATSARWPNGIVPYEIRGSFDAYQMSLIEKAFNEYHTRTCIRFVPRTNQQDYISIVNGNTGCWSSVGRIGGRQEVNFQTPGCMSRIGTVIHELMHACGFLHEQNRSERDSFVTINWSNVKSGTENNFEKATTGSTNAFGVGYDYGSVMHYSANAFSKNGQPTIIPRRSSAIDTIGQRSGFSDSDVNKLNKMYKCKDMPAGSPSSTFSSSSYPSASYGNNGGGGGGSSSSGVGGTRYPVLEFIGNIIRPIFQDNNTIAETNDNTKSDD